MPPRESSARRRSGWWLRKSSGRRKCCKPAAFPWTRLEGPGVQRHVDHSRNDGGDCRERINIRLAEAVSRRMAPLPLCRRQLKDANRSSNLGWSCAPSKRRSPQPRDENRRVLFSEDIHNNSALHLTSPGGLQPRSTPGPSACRASKHRRKEAFIDGKSARDHTAVPWCLQGALSPRRHAQFVPAAVPVRVARVPLQVRHMHQLLVEEREGARAHGLAKVLPFGAASSGAWRCVGRGPTRLAGAQAGAAEHGRPKSTHSSR